MISEHSTAAAPRGWLKRRRSAGGRRLGLGQDIHVQPLGRGRVELLLALGRLADRFRFNDCICLRPVGQLVRA
jgi:hypothetical protein